MPALVTDCKGREGALNDRRKLLLRRDEGTHSGSGGGRSVVRGAPRRHDRRREARPDQRGATARLPVRRGSRVHSAREDDSDDTGVVATDIGPRPRPLAMTRSSRCFCACTRAAVKDRKAIQGWASVRICRRSSTSRGSTIACTSPFSQPLRPRQARSCSRFVMAPRLPRWPRSEAFGRGDRPTAVHCLLQSSDQGPRRSTFTVRLQFEVAIPREQGVARPGFYLELPLVGDSAGRQRTRRADAEYARDLCICCRLRAASGSACEPAAVRALPARRGQHWRSASADGCDPANGSKDALRRTLTGVSERRSRSTRTTLVVRSASTACAAESIASSKNPSGNLTQAGSFELTRLTLFETVTGMTPNGAKAAAFWAALRNRPRICRSA